MAVYFAIERIVNVVRPPDLDEKFNRNREQFQCDFEGNDDDTGVFCVKEGYAERLKVKYEEALNIIEEDLIQSEQDGIETLKNVSELIGKKLNDVSTPQGNENKASRLRKIADKLSVWRASVLGEKGNPGNWVPSKLAEGGREAALESLKLLVDRDNNDLLHACSRSYGDNSDCRNALRHIDEHILVGIRTENRPLESFLGHGPCLALPGFIKDLR